MSELTELYQEVILDHNRKPRNYGEMENFSGQADGYNPLCGDRIKVFLRLEGGQITDIKFQGTGCAISQASASLMTEALKGKSVDDSNRLFEDFRSLVTGNSPNATSKSLGKLMVFGGVSKYPVRVKCATLAWHTLKAALEDQGQCTTEK
jgi:nitrogen fixation NifU-like protein